MWMIAMGVLTLAAVICVCFLWCSISEGIDEDE